MEPTGSHDYYFLAYDDYSFADDYIFAAVVDFDLEVSAFNVEGVTDQRGLAIGDTGCTESVAGSEWMIGLMSKLNEFGLAPIAVVQE